MKSLQKCSGASCQALLGVECLRRGEAACSADAMGNIGTGNIGWHNFGSSNPDDCQPTSQPATPISAAEPASHKSSALAYPNDPTSVLATYTLTCIGYVPLYVEGHVYDAGLVESVGQRADPSVDGSPTSTVQARHNLADAVGRLVYGATVSLSGLTAWIEAGPLTITSDLTVEPPPVAPPPPPAAGISGTLAQSGSSFILSMTADGVVPYFYSVAFCYSTDGILGVRRIVVGYDNPSTSSFSLRNSIYAKYSHVNVIGLDTDSNPVTSMIQLFPVPMKVSAVPEAGSGKLKAPMCWVMPPASRAASAVRRSASSSVVFPWSTWPITATTAGRGAASGASLDDDEATAAASGSSTAATPSSMAASSASSGDTSSCSEPGGEPRLARMPSSRDSGQPDATTNKAPQRKAGTMFRRALTLFGQGGGFSGRLPRPTGTRGSRARSSGTNNSGPSSARTGSLLGGLLEAGLASGGLSLLGDLLAQHLTSPAGLKLHAIDWPRSVRIASFGFLLYGPYQYWWYGALARSFPTRSLPHFLSKVAANQLILGPIVVSAIFAWNLGLQGQLSNLPSKLSNDFATTVVNGAGGPERFPWKVRGCRYRWQGHGRGSRAVSGAMTQRPGEPAVLDPIPQPHALPPGWKFWVPAASVNFFAIPLQHQVWYMSVCGLLWVTYLSYSATHKQSPLAPKTAIKVTTAIICPHAVDPVLPWLYQTCAAGTDTQGSQAEQELRTRCREALTKNHKEQARFARSMPSRLSLKQGQAGALLSPAHTHAIAEIATQHKDSPVVVNSAARVEPSTLISWLMLSTVPRASDGALPQMAAAAVAEAMTTSGESAMPTRAQSSHPSEGRKGALAVASCKTAFYALPSAKSGSTVLLLREYSSTLFCSGPLGSLNLPIAAISLKSLQKCSGASCQALLGVECLRRGEAACSADAMGNIGTGNIGWHNFGSSNVGSRNIGK
ncbi:hypothetical protein APUTEX25_001905 [Auxenochlorella protothecoides]|uniref:Uncharacterized protein n=1 Tax=Auxenochlorella protothecoides TaxID=3075 RepID=A0A3M7L6P0_AUXPR|nr:hypothetical protein APUTEX25_001905 [Auxenochlorella protothecoides]|eukprot:RMZ57705.1 hypothetical protein APUTEX25_001905 [Auxenochlorella protothecoides]